MCQPKCDHAPAGMGHQSAQRKPPTCRWASRTGQPACVTRTHTWAPTVSAQANIPRLTTACDLNAELACAMHLGVGAQVQAAVCLEVLNRHLGPVPVHLHHTMCCPDVISTGLCDELRHSAATALPGLHRMSMRQSDPYLDLAQHAGHVVHALPHEGDGVILQLIHAKAEQLGREADLQWRRQGVLWSLDTG